MVSNCFITNIFIRYIFLISDVPVVKKVVAKYSMVKKTSTDTLKDSLIKMIELDRYYSSIAAPLWNASIVRFRPAFFSYFDVLDNRNGVVVLREDNEEVVRRNDDEDGEGETALEREVRVAIEMNRAKLLQRMV